MKTVVIAKDPFEPRTWSRHETDDVCGLLRGEFGDEFPSTARIYHEYCAASCDVTPNCEADIAKLKSLDGRLYVVVYPADPVSIIINILIAVALSAVAYLLTPKAKAPTPIPNLAQRNVQSSSPNNELSARTNQARIAGRIPDIFGTVRATPDLLTVPYSIYENHVEIENAYMCLGRGTYDVDLVKDGDTLISEIAGSTVEVFAPMTSPNSGDDPQLRIGSPITDPLLAVASVSSVNGQTLRPQNVANVVGVSNIRFVYPDSIETNDSALRLDDHFAPGDTVIVSDAAVNSLNLAGTYQVISAASGSIGLTNPALVNAAWTSINALPGHVTDYCSPTIATTGDPNWIGPFTINMRKLDRVIANFIALNGLYKDNGSNQYALDVVVELEITPTTPGGSPIGPAETFQATVSGSATSRSTRAVTLAAVPTFTGPCSIRARRVTDTDTAFSGSVVDEIKWRNAYGAELIADHDFGNVTTVRALTYATAGALAVKERKLNMIATRKIPRRVSGSTFTTELFASTNISDIFCAAALDPYIGGRDVDELDVDNIYDTIDEVIAYFGSPEAGQFSYTFDKQGLSFEETAASIAQAALCVAYRRGHQTKLSFEKETDNSTLLFNHRNKLPKSEVRTINFGNGGAAQNYDGVTLKYVSPVDDAIIDYYVPTDRSAISPQKIETIGIRTDLQAAILAWRIFNKQRYQHVITEFDATQEADILVNNDRIRVADNTRTGTMDGEVIAQDVLDLTLSQDADIDPDVEYTIFLQHIDGTVESMPVTAGSSKRHVTLDHAPGAPLSLDVSNYARATYEIVPNDSTRTAAFLVMERNPKDNFTSGIKAMNYDARYYRNDRGMLDFFKTTAAAYLVLLEDI